MYLPSMQRSGMLSTLLAIPCAATLFFVTPAAAADVENGFVPIFNGKDLTGWEAGKPGYWSVENGAITGQFAAQNVLDETTYLVWRGGKPADFELRLAYRIEGQSANSGINFRSQDLPNAGYRGNIKGYQADIDVGPTYTGILYECHQREVMNERGQKLTIAEDGRRDVTRFADAAELQEVIKPADWNEYAIIARGPEIILKINGKVMSHLIDREKGKAAADGLIALQLHRVNPMKVQFKDIRLKLFNR